MISILNRSKPARRDETSEDAPVSSHVGDERQTAVDVPQSSPVDSDDMQSARADQPEQDEDAVDPSLAAARVDSTHCDDNSEKPSSSKTPLQQSIWRRVFFYSLPGAVMLAAIAVGYLKWQDFSLRELQTSREESVRAATDLTVKMLSYRPDTVENDLASAREQMTGAFRDSYAQLTRDVVIPGSKQKRISAVATVPAAASVSASHSRAVVLVFVNQSIVVADDAPSSTASSVKVTLNRVNNRWLISDFTPI